MQEVIAILEGATKQLCEAEGLDSFKKCTRALTARIYLAHGAIELAQAKLLLLQEAPEEECEE